jgi:hypothetical protein
MGSILSWLYNEFKNKKRFGIITNPLNLVAGNALLRSTG